MKLSMKISSGENVDVESWNTFLDDISKCCGKENCKVYHNVQDGLNFDVVSMSEIVVALSSAGLFTAFYKVINAYLTSKTKRKIIIETKGNKIQIESHNLHEEAELLNLLFRGNNDKKKLTEKK